MSCPLYHQYKVRVDNTRSDEFAVRHYRKKWNTKRESFIHPLWDFWFSNAGSTHFITYWPSEMSVWKDLRLLTHVYGVWHTLYIFIKKFGIYHKPEKSTMDMTLEYIKKFSITSKNISSTHSASDILSSKVVWHPFIRICAIFHCFTADVYHPQNAGYTRARTYITETDLETCISGPSTLIWFIRWCQFHPANLQNEPP